MPELSIMTGASIMRLSIIFLLAYIFSGCSSPRVTVAWKVEHVQPERHDKILVVGIIKSENDSLRKQIERDFSKALCDLGYDAVSAITEFGPGGLSGSGEIETYRKLCNSGFDAVMTIALIDESKEPRQRYQKVHGYPSNYYYNRIWNYKNIRADLTSASPGNGYYFWENILFDLNKLETECTVQSGSFKSSKLANMSSNFDLRAIQILLKERILTRQQSNFKTLRPF